MLEARAASNVTCPAYSRARPEERQTVPAGHVSGALALLPLVRRVYPRKITVQFGFAIHLTRVRGFWKVGTRQTETLHCYMLKSLCAATIFFKRLLL